MAKVIGFDERAKRRVTCQNCSAINEYNLNEVIQYRVTDYGSDTEIYSYVRCGHCEGRVQIRRA